MRGEALISMWLKVRRAVGLVAFFKKSPSLSCILYRTSRHVNMQLRNQVVLYAYLDLRFALRLGYCSVHLVPLMHVKTPRPWVWVKSKDSCSCHVDVYPYLPQRDMNRDNQDRSSENDISADFKMYYAVSWFLSMSLQLCTSIALKILGMKRKLK